MTEQHPRPWVPKYLELRTAAVNALLKYFARDAAGLDETAVLLRDSMLYRAESVGFHVDLLDLHLAAFTREAQPGTLSGHPQPHLHRYLHTLTFLSDDVLFNSISMLDYVGNVVGYTLAGPNCQSIKWNGMVKTSRDRANPLSKTKAAATMLQLHEEWLDKLHGVRSEIIHERVRLGDGSRITSFGGDRGAMSRLSIEMPPNVVKRLKFLQPDANGTVQLVSGTELIALRSLDSAKEVMSALMQDLVSVNEARQGQGRHGP